MIWLLPMLAFAGDTLPDADLVVLGEVTSAGEGERRALWSLARTLDLRVALPPQRPPRICVRVREVLVGELFGDEVCFWRVGLAAAEGPVEVGAAAVWLLEHDVSGDAWYTNEAGSRQPAGDSGLVKLTLAQRDRAPGSAAPVVVAAIGDAGDLRARLTGPSGVPSVKLTIAQGTPAQKRDAIGLAAEYTLVELVPALIAALTDPALVPGTTPERAVGTYAAEALYVVGERLDGVPADRRPPDRYAFPGGAMGYATRSTAVKQAWTEWWAAWQEDGPAGGM